MTSKNLQSILDNLSEEERNYANQIVKELTSQGFSSTLDEIAAEDYDEIPVDIYTFITDPDYLGGSFIDRQGNLMIYPYWVEVLKELFEPSSDYQEVALSGAIGVGKSTIACVGMAYSLYKLLCLKDPAGYYGLADTRLAIALFNINLANSYGVGYQKLQGFLQKSPWFLRNGKVVGTKNPTYHPGKGIDILVGSKMSHFLGYDVFCLSGDTVIKTPSGDRRLDELSKYESGVVIYQYNKDTNEVEVSDHVQVIPTKVVDEIYEIELEDGTIIKSSGDHRFLVNEEYVSVEDLSKLSESELQSIDFSITL